jgi:polysaccharide biosynthesis/export protein
MRSKRQRCLVCITGFLFLTVPWATGVCASVGEQKQETGAAPVVDTQQIKTAESADHNSTPAVLQERHSRYELHQGDIFDVTFPFTPEFNQTVTIQPDGYIALTGIGNLHVAGETVPQLSEQLRALYGKILHDPVVNIVLKDFEKPYFIASGELSRPGKYELRSDTTLTEAVAIAGGFTENSKHSEVYLFRRVANNWVELKKVDVKKMFKSADLTEDLHLQPGDMVFVPQNRYSKVKRYIPSPGVGMTLNPAY